MGEKRNLKKELEKKDTLRNYYMGSLLGDLISFLSFSRFITG